jgi:serine/threonine protein kinase
MSKEFDKILETYITNFDNKNKHSETHDIIIKKSKYFIKVVGKAKKEHMKNEISSLKELAHIFPIYKDYFVAFKEDKEHCAIMLKYIEGEDLKSLLSEKFDKKMVLCLYRMLFTKLQMFHDKNITHGDIKPQNFYSYIDPKDGMVKIKLIDTETCTFYDKLTDVDDIKRLRSLYYYLPDNPRSSTFFITPEEAFIFFRYLDHYSLACFMLYLYKRDVYKMLQKNDYKEENKNPWRFSEKELYSPYDYVDKEENDLEQALHYVFKYIPKNKDDLSKFNSEKLADILFK